MEGVILTTAKGCPMGLLTIPSKSVPMKKTNTMLMTRHSVSNVKKLKAKYQPQPRRHPNAGAVIIENGTTLFAFVASSLICTLESNPPTVHNGAKKLRTNANPFGHPYIFEKFPNANEALLWNSLGVAAGMATIIAIMRRMLSAMNAFWRRARMRVAILARRTCVRMRPVKRPLYAPLLVK